MSAIENVILNIVGNNGQKYDLVNKLDKYLAFLTSVYSKTFIKHYKTYFLLTSPVNFALLRKIQWKNSKIF